MRVLVGASRVASCRHPTHHAKSQTPQSPPTHQSQARPSGGSKPPFHNGPIGDRRNSTRNQELHENAQITTALTLTGATTRAIATLGEGLEGPSMKRNRDRGHGQLRLWVGPLGPPGRHQTTIAPCAAIVDFGMVRQGPSCHREFGWSGAAGCHGAANLGLGDTETSALSQVASPLRRIGQTPGKCDL